MKFDYDYYKVELCRYALIGLLMGVIILFLGIFFIFYKKQKRNVKWLCSIICFFIFIFYTITMAGQLKYGLPLLKEFPIDALKIQGEIEDIKEIRNPFTHNFKYAAREYKSKNSNAHLITISHKPYYFMIKGNLKIGDYVEIIYMPKSTIVLEVSTIEFE